MGAELAEIESLYRTSYPRYRNALATITGSYESARDAVQQAFAQAIAERAGFRREGSLSAWVWKIALRQALSLREEFADANLNGAFDPGLVEPTSDPVLSAAGPTATFRIRSASPLLTRSSASASALTSCESMSRLRRRPAPATSALDESAERIRTTWV